MAGKFKELLMKYGKVGLGVHCSISAASITGLYIAIKSNVDVESLLQKLGMHSLDKYKDAAANQEASEYVETTTTTASGSVNDPAAQARNRTAELAASNGGALALALLINKALFPVRVPATLALTRPVARFLVKRNIINNNGIV
ncbi:uncharacterized protein LOC127260678 [Andrographis paniculata]|uniref:uncharacterized protein LOC127260678 n=1 Tax=Andrographis paniculata TaxID=175694 RepID=UPI0021E905EA|nr:uncharacterized protein LOC127260678 [Andrographis paniculata]